MGIVKVEPQIFPHHCEGITNRTDDTTQLTNLLIIEGQSCCKETYERISKSYESFHMPQEETRTLSSSIFRSTSREMRGAESNTKGNERNR